MKAVGGPRKNKQRGHSRRHDGFNDRWDQMTKADQCSMGRNKRSVWNIATVPFTGAHFATFPPDLIKPCILAGTSERGCCPECGAPWKRIIEKQTNWQERKRSGAWSGNRGVAETYQNNVHGKGMSHDLDTLCVKQLGWRPNCKHDVPPVPCVVLDPFGGAGTTALVARQLGRHSIYIDLNPTYADMAIKRLEGQTLPLALEAL